VSAGATSPPGRDDGSSKRVLGKALATTVNAIEAQNYQPKKAQS